MKAKKYWIWVVVSFSILVVVWPARQITGKTGLSAKEKENDSNLITREKLGLSYKSVVANEKEVLKGLEGVGVLVEDIEPEVEKYGLTRKALQTDTELQLRHYGIKVLTEEELLSTPRGPYLYINVGTTIQQRIPFVAVAIIVELHENVLLLREQKTICYSASTWHRGGLVNVGLLRIKDLGGDVKELVNEFINDYLAANPSRETKWEILEMPKKRPTLEEYLRPAD